MSARITDQAASLRVIRGEGGEPPVRRERVVAVTGGKGGVGKSTVALGLATAYAMDGARTLMVDTDLGMADLNLLLGVAPGRSLLDALAGVPVEEVLVAAHGLQLLPAQNGSFALATMSDRARARALELCGQLSDRFDALVFDIAGGIGAHQAGFTAAAADRVVVVNPEPLSMADAYACLKVLVTEHGIDTAYVVPNRVVGRAQGDEIVLRLTDLVNRFLDLRLIALPPIPADPAVGEAAAHGVPLLRHRPDSPAARAIRRVARALDAHASPDLRAEVARGFWRRHLALAQGDRP
ncbi:MAG TPA: P-loop NTPase [Kofleriaceae bacterium]|nr:P-loop NTPase [Kofleriaceae bacterium]